MDKFRIEDIQTIKVTSDDPQLESGIPLLGIEQGRAHETRLPDQPEHMTHIAENFRHALKNNHVEIWRLEKPAPAAGAVFLSPLQKDGEKGIQIDDVVVMPDYRHKNLGSMLICFTAALAKSRGLSFVTWECEESNTAQKVYRGIGANPRENVKPFRLTRDIILKAITNSKEASLDPETGFIVSNRFSLFRTVNHGIEGYDMDPTQRSLGLQIEDLTFGNVHKARQNLIATLSKYRDQKAIDFVDIIIPTNSAKHLELIASFDAEQNTYSGNPAYLWELSGEAFEQAAVKGQPLLHL